MENFIFYEVRPLAACLVLSGLNDIFHWYAQSCMTIKSLLNDEAEIFTQLITKKNEISLVSW